MFKFIKRSLSVGIILVFLCIPDYTHASWSEPQVIIQGSWGIAEDEFGLGANDVADLFPRNIMVMTDGRILIEDWINNRLKLYQPDGKFMKSLPWPGPLFFELDADRIVGFQWDDIAKTERVGVVSLNQGEWLWVDRTRAFNSASMQVAVVNRNIILWDGGKSGYAYSDDGKQRKNFLSKPAELGIADRAQYGLSVYRYVLKYPGKTYVIEAKELFSRFARDRAGLVYGIAKVDRGEEFGVFQVNKYSFCGKLVGEMRLPLTRFEFPDKESSGEPDIEHRQVVQEFGEPIIASNGDVYAWRRTADSFSVFTWAWRDDPGVSTGPDAPVNLAVAAAERGLSLAWKASPQDPGCVTGYEVVRADDANGPYTILATTAQGTLRYNDTTTAPGSLYYYRVRALAGKVMSPLSAAMLGVVPGQAVGRKQGQVISEPTSTGVGKPIVLSLANELMKDIMRLTKLFPGEEALGLTEKLRQTMKSIIGDIAGSYEKKRSTMRQELLTHAKSSLSEVAAYLHLARDRGYIGQADFLETSRTSGEIARHLDVMISRKSKKNEGKDQ